MSDSLQPYVARQVPLSMGFSRQEYWSGLPYPPPGDLPNPGIEPMSFTSPALAGRFFTTSATWEAPICIILIRQEDWSGLPFPSPGDLPGPGIEPRSPALQADALISEPPGKP